MFSKPKFNKPTDINPIIYDELIFYGNHMVFDNEKHDYKNIQFITYSSEKNTVNGFATVHKAYAYFFLRFNDESFWPEDDFDQFFLLEFQKGLLPIGNKLIHKLNFITDYLSTITFNQRLNRYYKYLEKDGFFNYTDTIKFTNSGDIYENEIFIGNIRKAYSENKFIYGDSFSTYKQSYSDPYTFGINLGTSFFGLKQNNWIINLTTNKDVFDFILKNLLAKGLFTG